MKKVIFVTLLTLILASCAIFAGCSSVSQTELLSSPLVATANTGYELYTYDVYKDSNPVGTMTMKFERYENKDATLDWVTKVGFTGTKLTTDVSFTMPAGDNVHSEILYSSNFKPVYSYKTMKVTTENETIDRIQTVYYTSKYSRSRLFENGKLVKYAQQKIKGKHCFDNEMLYALVRSASVGDSSFSISYAAPSALTGGLDNMTIAKRGVQKENIDALGGETDCFAFKISNGNQYAKSYEMFIAKSKVQIGTGDDAFFARKVITKIVEGDYSYILKAYDIL